MIYTISVALEQEIIADSEEQALKIANRYIDEGNYTIEIVDKRGETDL